MSPAVRGKVQQALVGLNGSESGRGALQGLKVKGFEMARNADWDDVRALQIDARLGAQD